MKNKIIDLILQIIKTNSHLLKNDIEIGSFDDGFYQCGSAIINDLLDMLGADKKTWTTMYLNLEDQIEYLNTLRKPGSKQSWEQLLTENEILKEKLGKSKSKDWREASAP